MKQEKLSGSLQINLLATLVWDEKKAFLVRDTVKIGLFASQQYRTVVGRVYEYLDTYKHPPADHFPDLIEDLTKDEKDGELYAEIQTAIGELEKVNSEYVIDQLSIFVRRQSMAIAVVEANQALQANNLDQAELILSKAAKARLEVFESGITLPEGLDLLRLGEIRDPLNLAIGPFDAAGIGPARKELHIFLAPTGFGKSWWLVHLAKRGLLARLRVLYVTLELAAKVVSQRVLMSLFGIATRKRKEGLLRTRLILNDEGQLVDIKREPHEARFIFPTQWETDQGDGDEVWNKIALRLDKTVITRNLRIKEFPTHSLTMTKLRAYLEALEDQVNFIPDLLLLDYAHLMFVRPDNFRIELGALLKDLRGLAVERNMMLATAAQSNRAGAEAELTRSTHAGEDWSQIETADGVVTYSQTAKERRLHLARLLVEKARTDEDKFSVLVAQQYATGQFALSSSRIGLSYDTLLRKIEVETQTKDEED